MGNATGSDADNSMRRKSSEDEDIDREAAKRAAAARLRDALASVDDMVGQAAERLIRNIESRCAETLGVETTSQLVEEARTALDAVTRSAAAGMTTYSESEAENLRIQLKAQSVGFDIKLATARKAGEMQLKNQAVELEHVHNRAMENKMAQLSMGGDALLREANEQLTEHKERLSALEPKMRAADEQLRVTKNLLATAESRIGSSEAKAGILSQDAENAKGMLAAALTSLQVRPHHHSRAHPDLAVTLELTLTWPSLSSSTLTWPPLSSSP